MNLADSAFSGSSELRNAVCLATAAALAFASGSSPSAPLLAAISEGSTFLLFVLSAEAEELIAGIGNGACACASLRFKSEIIWSAVFLRSEDRNGASGLI